MLMDVSSLKKQFPNLQFKLNESLAAYTYMKVGGLSAAFVVVHTKDDLFSLCSFCFSENIPFIILGGGSNVVVPDEGLQKLVILNKTKNISIRNVGDGSSEVQADSGVV